MEEVAPVGLSVMSDVQNPTSPVPRGSMGGNPARARSTNDSTMSGRDDGEAPACFSGESNDSHAEHQVWRPSFSATTTFQPTFNLCKPLENLDPSKHLHPLVLSMAASLLPSWLEVQKEHVQMSLNMYRCCTLMQLYLEYDV